MVWSFIGIGIIVDRVFGLFRTVPMEDKTKETGFPILISDETYQALGEVPDVGAKSLNDVHIKGKRDKVTIYALSV